MAKRGRPRGLNLNPDAFLDLLDDRGVSKVEIAEVGGLKTGHLSDALLHQKGVSETAVNKMSKRLRCRPATIAPELNRKFVAVRVEDDLDEILDQRVPV